MLLLPTAVMMASVWTSETTTKINSFVFLLLTSFSLCILPSVFLLYLHLYRIFLSHPCNTLNKSFPPLKLRPVSRNVEIWQCCDVVSYPRERNSQLHCCENLKYASFSLLNDDFSQNHAPAALHPRERPGTHFTEGWVGPRAGLDGWKM